jgi:molybdopterin-containing oxidoreductase family iron-sulfur binding subunit
MVWEWSGIEGRMLFDRRGLLRLGALLGMAGVTGALVGCDTAGREADGYEADGRKVFGRNADGSESASEGGSSTGVRWGLAIDVEAFNAHADMTKIAAACHQAHNVPQIDDPKQEVKWIWQDNFEHCFAEMDSNYLAERIKELSFPVLCNHCESPACVRVCPTEATFQRSDGIVAMDYHRCIGCRFCMTGCPYNARSLNFSDPREYLETIDSGYPTRTKGVVEKCNFCVERINRGEQPLCVEASEGTISFGDLNDPASAVSQTLERGLALRRRPELGTGPSVYYVFAGGASSA